MKLILGSYYFTSQINAAFGLDGYPDTVSPIPVKLKIKLIKNDIFWGEFIQFPLIKDKVLTSYFTGVVDEDGILTLITTNFSRNIQGIERILGSSPGYSITTRIKNLKNDTYEIISTQSPGYISKSIGIFKAKKK